MEKGSAKNYHSLNSACGIRSGETIPYTEQSMGNESERVITHYNQWERDQRTGNITAFTIIPVAKELEEIIPSY
jgi:hypothetical protein